MLGNQGSNILKLLLSLTVSCLSNSVFTLSLFYGCKIIFTALSFLLTLFLSKFLSLSLSLSLSLFLLTSVSSSPSLSVYVHFFHSLIHTHPLSQLQASKDFTKVSRHRERASAQEDQRVLHTSSIC